jgi:hypothetical protein
MLKLTLFSAVVFFFCFSCCNAQATNGSTYTYDGDLGQDDIDQSILYGSPGDINQMDEGKAYMDQIIDNSPTEFSATSGCLNVTARDGWWGGQAAGGCANVGSNGQGAIRFGSGNTIVSQTQDAIAEALKIAGITVVGYRYQWKVKNYNAMDDSEIQTAAQDPLYVRVIVKDPSGNVLDEKEFDYSKPINDWQLKYGMYWYEPFITGDKIDTITLEVEGKDAAGSAGYYGSEFREAGIYSILVVDPIITQDCTDPLLDATCPGYADALVKQQDEIIAQIAETTSIEVVPEVVPVEEEVAFIDEITQITEAPIAEEPVIVSVETVVVEPIQEVIVEETVEVITDVITEITEAPLVSNVTINPLSIAQDAVSGALAQANINISNTLNQTNNSVLTSESAFNDQQTGSDLLQNDISNNQFGSDQGNDSSLIVDNYGKINTELSSLNNAQMINNTNQSDGFGSTANSAIDTDEIVIEITVDSFEIAALDLAIDQVFQPALNKNADIQIEQSEEEQVSFEEQNAEEDVLVEQALSGDESEDAQAALLGYNPKFRAYQSQQMPDGQFYQSKEIYGGQENYDNPAARFFNGASDEKHRAMVRQQYERN